MKVKFLLLLGVLILGLAAIGSGSGVDQSSLLKLISPAVVSVQAFDPEEGEWNSASGFIIDPSGKVITTCSAVLNATEINVQLRDGSRYEATVERCSEDDIEAKMLDVAVLQLQGVSGYLPQVWLGDSAAVRLGEEVMVLSYPGPYGEFNVVNGVISGRLTRQYLTLEDAVYRVAFLAQIEVDWETEAEEEGWIVDIGEILDLDYAHPTLAELASFVQKDTLILAIAEPLEDDLFCGVVSSIEGQGIVVDEISCLLLFLALGVVKTGQVATLDREIEFLKTSAPIEGGSSGGPVFNLSGQVIGMVSWGRGVEVEITDEEEIEPHYWPGTTYVIPADLIKPLLEDH